MDRLLQLDPGDLEMRNAALRRYTIVSAIAALIISLSMVLVWVSGPRALAEFTPFLFQMKVNAAIGFACAAGALLALQLGRRHLSLGLAFGSLVIGGGILLEYAGVPLGIDQLLVRDWCCDSRPHPGRVAPNTATALVVLAAILLVLGATTNVRLRNLTGQFAPLMVIAFALEAIVGHIGQSPFALSWWAQQPMSIPSIICALGLGSGLLAYGWQFETARIARVPLWLPLLYCFLVALIDVYTSLDLDAGILYVPLVLAGLWFERAGMAFVLAAISTLFITLGMFASPAGEIAFETVIANRVLAICCVWLVAAVVYAQHVMKRRLRRSEHHLTAAQHIAEVGSFELDLASESFHGSTAFREMHRLDGEDWPSFLRNAVSPDDRPALKEMLSAARAGARSRDLEYSFVGPTGAVRNGLMHCDLLLDRVNQPAAIIGVVRDVTEARMAMARNNDLEAQLRHAQKLESLGILAGSIAHDLNNTLVPIATLAPLLMESAEEADREILQIILDSSRRAKELVREMLVFSRKDETAPEAIRLDQLAEEALVILRAGVPASIEIARELSPVPEIVGTKGQIYQTILNLVTNAAQAIGDRAGKITIGVEREDGAQTGPGIRLFVADDGPGMDTQTVERIFEPFFSTKTKSTGTGLGLAIVNGIMKKHGGSIRVRSAVGQGTRFDLSFPIRAPS